MSTQKPKTAANTSRRWRWLAALAAVLVTAGAVYGAVSYTHLTLPTN